MTVVEYGDRLTVIRDDCSNCGSIFEYTEEFDVRLKKSGKKGYEYIVCPVCRKWLTRNIIDYEEEEEE